MTTDEHIQKLAEGLDRLTVRHESLAQSEKRVNEALDRLTAALRDVVVAGPRVNTSFLKALAEHPEFRAGRFDTGFVDRHLCALVRSDPENEAQTVAQGVAFLLDRERARIAGVEAASKSWGVAWRDPWSANDGFALGPARVIALDILVDGVTRQASVTWGPRGAQVTVDAVTAGIAAPAASRVIDVADGAVVVAGGRQYHVALMRHDTLGARHLGDDGAVRAPMNGKIVAVFVEPGQSVKKGARIALMEAMKMEHMLTAPMDGIVTEVVAVQGAQAVAGAVLVRIEAETQRLDLADPEQLK